MDTQSGGFPNACVEVPSGGRNLFYNLDYFVSMHKVRLQNDECNTYKEWQKINDPTKLSNQCHQEDVGKEDRVR